MENVVRVVQISNVHSERNINVEFVILVKIRWNGISDDSKSNN